MVNVRDMESDLFDMAQRLSPSDRAEDAIRFLSVDVENIERQLEVSEKVVSILLFSLNYHRYFLNKELL